MSRPFRASYDGECDECGNPIDEGDLITADDGNYLCADCGTPDLFADFDGPTTAPRKPKPKPRQPFQGTSLDDMGY